MTELAKPLGTMVGRIAEGRWSAEAFYVTSEEATAAAALLDAQGEPAPEEVPEIGGIDPRLKPMRIWRLFEVQGFQILAQLFPTGDDEDDRPCLSITSPMNGIDISVKMRGPNAGALANWMEALDGTRALQTILTQAAPMIDMIVASGEGQDDDA